MFSLQSASLHHSGENISSRK